jgi:hypothetical protein
MRVGMGLIKNEYGVWHVRRSVPKALRGAVARVMGAPKERVSWLKKTLRTKDEKRAKALAKPVMIEFDRILAQAEALLVEHPVRTELTEAEIKQIADYFYAHELGADQELREEGIGSDPVFASVHRQLAEAGIEFDTPFEVEDTGCGLSARMMYKVGEDASVVLSAAKRALARGNVNFIPDDVPWADPVSGMRLKVPRSTRRPWEPEELSVLFNSPIYLEGVRPKGGKGEAAFWLPLLALYSGARLNLRQCVRIT